MIKNSIIYYIDTVTDKIYETYPTHIATTKKFNLYLDYRAQLQSYTKMFFDPFRRYSRITFVLENTPMVSIETTVGQLNFFRWALQNGVIDYINAHATEIEDSMTNFQKQTKMSSPEENTTASPQVKPRKTKLKTKQAVLTHTISRVPCLIHFD